MRTVGSVSIEAVLIIPAFLLFLVLILAIGRIAMVKADLHASVVNAARVASMETCSWCADTAARTAITTTLVADKVPCLDPDIVINAAALDQPPGQPGSVSASITCVVQLSDLGVPGMPGQIRITSSFATSIDPYVPG